MNRLTILGVCLILSLSVAGAYGHGEGKCLTDTDGNVRFNNDGWVKVSHLIGEDLDEFAHGHLHKEYDKRGNSTGQTMTFFSIYFDDDEGDYFADCPPPKPERMTAEAYGLTPNPEPESDIKIAVYEPDEQNEVEPSTPVNSCDPPESVESYNPIIPVQTVEVEEQVVEEINEVAEEIIEEVVPKTYRFEYGYWYQGYNLVSFPVLPEGIVTIRDLFDRYSLFADFELLNENPIGYTGDKIIVYADGCWLGYGGEDDNVIGDIEITPYMGFGLLMDYSGWIAMSGRRLVGDGSYELQAGVNLLGITQMPVGIEKPSDFLLVDGVHAVISRVITGLGKEKDWHLIGRIGDPGDEYPVALGQAYILITSWGGGVIDFEDVPDGDIAAAPMAPRVDNIATSWGSIKVR